MTVVTVGDCNDATVGNCIDAAIGDRTVTVVGGCKVTTVTTVKEGRYVKEPNYEDPGNKVQFAIYLP